jgi:hypothetical protein
MSVLPETLARAGRSALGRPRRLLALGTSALLAGTVFVGASGTPARAIAGTPVEPTGATINTSFAPNKLGAKAAFTFTVHFSGGESGVPSPVRKAVVHFPPGLSLNIPSIRSCTRARLQARGAQGCPKRSLIGNGHALADIHAGASIEREEAVVSAFLGPPQGTNPTIEILGQGYTPLDERVVITGTVLEDNPPYGEKIVMSIPPIPSIPLEPDASTSSFTLTVGGARYKTHDPNTVVVPSSCPTGGFPFAAEFTYADGTTSTSTTTIPCP